jgi:ABC-type lipoprotein export system ATPase subunit
MEILQLTQLKKSYVTPDGGQHCVVDVPEFRLAEKTQVALSGESGSGKTTLLNLIAGILKPDSGVITVAGREMSALNEPGRDRLRASTIGYIFQTFNLLQGYTCLENVLLGMSFGAGVDRPFAQELLRRVGLGDRMMAVARALANRPKLVLADEPTGNLDHKNAREALALIRENCAEAGASLLLVSHDREVLQQFQTVHRLAEINRAAAREERA